MSACGPHDPGVKTMSSSRGSAPPFLPTLATALAVGLLSLICRGPSAPETPAAPVATAQASPAGADGFHPARPMAETAPVIPAALAFARLHPLTLQIPHLAEAEEVRVPVPRAARSAAATRRACTAPRCAEARRVDTASRTAPVPVRTASEPAAVPDAARGTTEPDEGLLPPGAIPFAATATAWAESARKLGSSVAGGAASLGGSAVELLASAR